jgi:hypothetical protein
MVAICVFGSFSTRSLRTLEVRRLNPQTKAFTVAKIAGIFEQKSSN